MSHRFIETSPTLARKEGKRTQKVMFLCTCLAAALLYLQLLRLRRLLGANVGINYPHQTGSGKEEVMTI